MGHLGKDHKGDDKDVGKILQSYPMSPACNSCLLHPSLPDSPSPRNKGVSYSLWTFITDLQIPPRLLRWPTQLLSLLGHPTASPFQSILTPLTLQCLCLTERESMQGSTLTFGKGWACASVFKIITEICFCLPFLWLHENSYLNAVLICTKKHFPVVLISLCLCF